MKIIFILLAEDDTFFKSLNHQNTGSDSPRSQQRHRELKNKNDVDLHLKSVIDLHLK